MSKFVCVFGNTTAFVAETQTKEEAVMQIASAATTAKKIYEQIIEKRKEFERCRQHMVTLFGPDVEVRPPVRPQEPRGRVGKRVKAEYKERLATYNAFLQVYFPLQILYDEIYEFFDTYLSECFFNASGPRRVYFANPAAFEAWLMLCADPAFTGMLVTEKV
jgi:hypothetical protein